jgi:hypothetical protein
MFIEELGRQLAVSSIPEIGMFTKRAEKVPSHDEALPCEREGHQICLDAKLPWSNTDR